MNRHSLPLAGLLLLLAAGPARADGCFIPREQDVPLAESALSQNAQRALIDWEGGLETLHLKSNYTGPAADFAWIIPVPGRPLVGRSDWSRFWELEEATRPRIRLPGGGGGGKMGCMCAMAAGPLGGGERGLGVARLESLVIGDLEVEVLRAREGGGLLRWLELNGYRVPARAKPVLQAYVERDFYFVAAKVRADQLAAVARRQLEGSGASLTPLAITFRSDRPFFPLEISRVSSAPENELLLLVLAPAPMAPNEYRSVRLTADDFRRGDDWRRADSPLFLEGAIRRAQGRQFQQTVVVEAVERYDQSLGPDRWLTRLHALLSPAEMQDLSFSPRLDWEPFLTVYDLVEDRLDRAALPLGLLFAAGGLSWLGRRRRVSPARRRLPLLLLLPLFCLV